MPFLLSLANDALIAVAVVIVVVAVVISYSSALSDVKEGNTSAQSINEVPPTPQPRGYGVKLFTTSFVFCKFVHCTSFKVVELLLLLSSSFLLLLSSAVIKCSLALLCLALVVLYYY